MVAAALTAGGWLALDGVAAASAVESPVVPHTAGMMGAVEAPASTDDASSLPTVFQVGGGLLLAGGALTAARSWVSPRTAG